MLLNDMVCEVVGQPDAGRPASGEVRQVPECVVGPVVRSVSFVCVRRWRRGKQVCDEGEVVSWGDAHGVDDVVVVASTAVEPCLSDGAFAFADASGEEATG